MSKTLWNDTTHGAPAPVRQRIENALANRAASPGARIETAIEIAFKAGFDFPEPNLPELDQLESLVRAKSASLAVFVRDAGFELDAQRRARDLWQRMRPWAAGEPAHVLAKQAQAEREAADRAAAVERRATELLAEQERMRVDTAHRKAVQAAQKELGE